MPPELRAHLDQGPTIEAVAAAQAEIAGLRADLRAYRAEILARADVPLTPAPLIIQPARTSRVIIALLALIAVLLAVLLIREPAHAQNNPQLPGVQNYCTTINATPAPNGLVPLTCSTTSPGQPAMNVNVVAEPAISTIINPYNATTGQTPQTQSFSGIAGYNGATVDAFLSALSGTSIPLGTAGFFAITGSGPAGTVPVELPIPVTVGGSVGQLVQDGSSYLEINCKTGCSGSSTFPYSGTSNGQTATSASFLGAGGLYNSSAPTLSNTQFSPLQLDASGRLIVDCGTGCPSTVAATQSGTWNIGSITTLPALATGSNTIGAVQGTSTTSTYAPTITSSSSYSAGNCIGSGTGTAGQAALLTLTSAFRSGDDSGVLNSLTVSMNSAQTTTLYVFVFSTTPGTSVCSDKGAPSIATGDSAKQIAVITLNNPTSALGTTTLWNLSGIGQQITSSSTSLYLYVVAASAVTTGASATMSVSAGILQD